nr:MAG TPA: hypothetical protein [Caudoviricetes sp.]
MSNVYFLPLSPVNVIVVTLDIFLLLPAPAGIFISSRA